MKTILTVILAILLTWPALAIADGCLSNSDCSSGCCLYTKCSTSNCIAPEQVVARAAVGLSPLRERPTLLVIGVVLYLLQRLITAFVGRSRRRYGLIARVLGRLSSATWRDAPNSLKLPLARMPMNPREHLLK